MNMYVNIHPGRLTWNIQITHLKRKIIFQTPMIVFHVKFRGVYDKNSWKHMMIYMDREYQEPNRGPSFESERRGIPFLDS